MNSRSHLHIKSRKVVKRLMIEYDVIAFTKPQHLVISVGTVSLTKVQDNLLQPSQWSKIISAALNFHSSFSLH